MVVTQFTTTSLSLVLEYSESDLCAARSGDALEANPAIPEHVSFTLLLTYSEKLALKVSRRHFIRDVNGGSLQLSDFSWMSACLRQSNTIRTA